MKSIFHSTYSEQFSWVKTRWSFYVIITVTLFCASIISSAESITVKRKLAGNRTLQYLLLPAEVKTIDELFSKSVFYARFRTNAFYWDWENEGSSSKDNYALGIGGSLIYKSPRLQGWSLTTAVYTSQNPFVKMDREDVGFMKAGKDVLSRSQVEQSDDYQMTVLGETFLEYHNNALRMIVGRQFFESVYTASNDTKMIPNTFDGIRLEYQLNANHFLRFAFFDKQKLRDHTTSHDLITFRDANNYKWGNQDDSAIHKGLNYNRFLSLGKSLNHDLFLFHYKGKLHSAITVDTTSFAVKDVFSGYTLELKTTHNVGEWKLSSGIRYMQQIDDGGGAVGGAALSGTVNHDYPGGYTHPDNMDSYLIALRVALISKSKVTQWQLGYSTVADKADFLTPWRGFPTGGYTRAMGQYNWLANTHSYMLQFKIDMGKAGWVPGMKVVARYALMDFDEEKGRTDRNILHMDFTYVPAKWKQLELKVRLGFIDDSGSQSYGDYRIETNLLF